MAQIFKPVLGFPQEGPLTAQKKNGIPVKTGEISCLNTKWKVVPARNSGWKKRKPI